MEIQKKLEELGTAFEAFKKTNDQALQEAKANNGKVSAATEEKLAKTESHIADLEKKIEGMNAALARAAQGNGSQEDEAKKELQKYKNSVFGYMRKGRAVPEEEVKAAMERMGFDVKTMSVDNDADGGYLVAPEMSSEMVKKLYESSPIRQLATVQTISSDSFELLHDLGEAGSGWVGETGARTATNTPQLKKEIVPVHELYAFPFATQKLLDDAALNLEAWLNEKVSDKFSRDEATAFISGNGVNKPKGILSYASGTSFGQIERVNTAANNAIAGNDVIELQTALKEGYQANAKWLINRSIIGALRKLKDVTSGQYIWQPGLSVGVPNQLLGKEIFMAADLPSSVAASTDMIMYGDFKAGYIIVDRIGIRVLRDAFTSKPYVGFYTTKRVGGAVKNFEAIKVLKTIS